MPSIFITGATGSIGQEVVAALTRQGVSFRTSTHQQVIHTGMPEAYLDFRKPETFLSGLTGSQEVFLLYPPALGNVQNIYTFIETAKQQGVKQIVFLSVMGAEKLAEAPHAQIERYIVESGIHYTFLRPSFFMQNLLTSHVNEIRYENTLYIPAGLSKTSLIDAQDIGEAVALSMRDTRHWNKAYTLTGGESLSYAEVAQILTEELRRMITYANPSPEQFREHMLSKGVPAQFVEMMLHVYEVAISGLAEAVTPDLENILGHKPKTIRDFVRAYHDQF